MKKELQDENLLNLLGSIHYSDEEIIKEEDDLSDEDNQIDKENTTYLDSIHFDLWELTLIESKDDKSYSKNQIQVYRMAFRWTECEGVSNFKNPSYLEDCLKKLSDEYVFQLEKGEKTKKLHYQGYVKLKKKTRPKTMGMRLNKLFKGIEFQACSNDEGMKEYCSKMETRVEGPWSSEVFYDKEDILPIEKNPYNWQKEILNYLSEKPNNRKIIWIYDYAGCNGKSILVKYLCVNKKAYLLGWADSKDILYAVSNLNNPQIILFDFTRTKPYSSKWEDIYASIEMIKNGCFFSSKYVSKMKIMSIPHLVVMSNSLPDLSTLSTDRWELARIGNETKDLKYLSSLERRDLYYEYYMYLKQQRENEENDDVKMYSTPFIPSGEFLEKWGD